MRSTMTQNELDRWYSDMLALKILLRSMQEKDKEAERVLRESQNAFAAETPVAWIAIVCEDYTCPNTGAPYQQLLPVSRYCRVTTAAMSYGFGTMRFEVVKRGGRVQGIRFRAEYCIDDIGSESDPVDTILDLNLPHPFHGYNIWFCVFEAREQAEAWLEEEEGILFEDSAQITRDRLGSKT